MAFVQFSQVSLAFGNRDILVEANLNLASFSRAALAGPNGAGKSTLMKIIAGQIAPDSGERAIQKDTRVSYLPQYGIVHQGKTLLEEVEAAFDPIVQILIQAEELGHELERAKEDDPKTQALIERYHALQERVENSGYYRRSEQIEQVVSGLGFHARDYSRNVEEFSGGWQMRIALAKALLESPDILLLDEPTNYLDIEARDWLEAWLKNFSGGFLIVSHDRYFLDVTVNEVYELYSGKLTRYAGNYTAYEERRSKELEQLFELWERQQEEIAKLEDFIRRFRYNSSKAALVQSRVKELDKIVPIVIPEGMKRIHFSFPEPPHSGRIAFTLENVSKSYGENHVIKNLDLIVDAGEKIAFVGKNGAGKSTLMRIIAGVDAEYSGLVKPGTGIEIAYFSQDNADTLKGAMSVEEAVEAICPTDLIPKVRSLLGAFLFRADDVFKSVNVLSGGERSRLALLSMLLHPSNLLVLDEPTNHLDLTSKDVLLEALKRFPGTVLFVSHDRYFIDELATKILEVKPEGTMLFPGGFQYYLDRKAKEEAAESEVSGELSLKKAIQGNSDSRSQMTENQMSREDEKKRKSLIKKLEKKEEELLEKIDVCESEKNRLESEMSKEVNYTDGLKMKKLADLVAVQVEEGRRLTEEWEATSIELEALRN